MTGKLLLREGTKADIPLILELVRALADYEKLAGEVTATGEQLSAALFGDRPLAEVLLAFWEGEPSGFAVYFYQLSTFKAAPVLYLEDLFVKPEWRRRGIGKALFDQLLAMAKARGCCRMQWSVLDWNSHSMGFYESIGAKPLKEWVRFGLDLP